MILFQLNVMLCFKYKNSFQTQVINNTLFHLALAPLSIELSVYKREIFSMLLFISVEVWSRLWYMQVVQLSDVGIIKEAQLPILTLHLFRVTPSHPWVPCPQLQPITLGPQLVNSADVEPTRYKGITLPA